MWKWANYVHAEAARVGRKALLVNLDETSIPVMAAPRGAVVRYDAEGRRKLKTGPKLGPQIRILSVTEKCGQFCGQKMAALLGSASGSLLFRREDGDMRRPRLWSPSSLALFMRVV